VAARVRFLEGCRRGRPGRGKPRWPAATIEVPKDLAGRRWESFEQAAVPEKHRAEKLGESQNDIPVGDGEEGVVHEVGCGGEDFALMAPRDRTNGSCRRRPPETRGRGGRRARGQNRAPRLHAKQRGKVARPARWSTGLHSGGLKRKLHSRGSSTPAEAPLPRRRRPACGQTRGRSFEWLPPGPRIIRLPIPPSPGWLRS